jgi:hypothetical protein
MIVSYDMFVQAFADGDAAPMPSAAFDVFRPHIDRTEPERHFWHLRAPDGGEADIHVDAAPGTFDSLMINHFSEGSALDLLAEFTIRAGGVILASDGPVMLTAETQREDLPEGLEGNAIIIRSADDIRQALARPADGQYRMQLTKVTSFLVMTQTRTDTWTGSLDQLEAAARSALVHNLLLGWWAIPGLIRTPMALTANASAIRLVHDQVSGKC